MMPEWVTFPFFYQMIDIFKHTFATVVALRSLGVVPIFLRALICN